MSDLARPRFYKIHRSGITSSQFRDARLRADLTQKQLADRLGLPLFYVVKWEHGGHPRPAVLAKLREILDLPPENGAR